MVEFFKCFLPQISLGPFLNMCPICSWMSIRICLRKFSSSGKYSLRYPLLEKSPYSELFWSVFSRIWNEYEEIVSLQFDCGEMQTGITPNMDTFQAVVFPSIVA